jgi:outer membrane protein TolC
VQLALQERPDLAQARLQLERGELDLVRTRNGLLPKLDLFVRLGGSRYADSFSAADDEDGHDASYAVGLNFEMPLGNRSARASYERSQLSLEQARAALRNMEQLVQVDVRSACVDVESVAGQVKATAATRALREKTLDTEREKFRVGKSTTLLVSQAARDALASQIAESEAIVAYRKALLALYRLEGSLLARRGIAVPR